ncbi:actin-like protein arp5 [Cokeromyces recurvatus]|uniref:actin-like protein arp5 n=1 Tax=Cokeromyces recurvatus TaxID=90255 RepID=UPI002220671F|nr:actin-like protein arp5 [Cokeromyces recurvatus]KAI7906081.1 actin-like protein arp5 [Cokeromyces recurvatus]
MVEASIPLFYTLEEKDYTAPYYSIRTDYKKHHSLHTPIVIDNGSNQCRAGWASDKNPALIFDNIVSKYRDRRLNESVLAVGMDALADPAAKSNARSPFDNNVVCDFEKMENILDYIFIILGINTLTIDHPILMTEAPCVPQYSRSRMTELLFENYSVPSIGYGIDSLFSYYANEGMNEKGSIIVSCGNNTTHIIPTLNGKGLLSKTKRINYGGTQSSDYMLKLMQLKYPTFPTKMTGSQAQTLVHQHAYVASDYQAALKQLENRDKFDEMDRIIQFPYTAPVIEEKTIEELARQAAKREENAKRLREAAARSRLEKLVAREQQLEVFMNLKNAKGTIKKIEWIAQLKEAGFKDEADLDDTIKQLEKAIQRARNKELGIEEVEEKEPPVTDLIDIPDEELDDTLKKEKRKQKLMKANYDARQRAKKAKEEIRRQEEELARQEEQKRLDDPEGWLSEIKEKRQKVIDRIKQRKRLASELADRRSRASQLRMKSIANLASDTNNGPASKRRRKGTDEDTFGQDDDDWAIYREISRDDESDEEEEDMSELNQYESLLLQYDPEFLPEHSYENMSSPTNTLMHLLAHGVYPPYDPTDMGQSYQLHVNIERVRVPEVIFQPSIIGLDQAGLVETVYDIVKTFQGNERENVMKNIFLTGGFSQLPGLTHRLHTSLQSIYPVETKIKIKRAKDPVLDAWKGAAMFARDESNKDYFITKQEYEEYGSDYIKEHGLGNVIQK